MCYVKIGNVDPKPTNVSGSDGAGAADKNECNTSLTGSSIDNPNNNHSNFSPQGNLQNNSSTMNNGGKDTSNSDVQKLQEQLNDIKEQVCYFSRQIFYLSKYNKSIVEIFNNVNSSNFLDYVSSMLG